MDRIVLANAILLLRFLLEIDAALQFLLLKLLLQALNLVPDEHGHELSHLVGVDLARLVFRQNFQCIGMLGLKVRVDLPFNLRAAQKVTNELLSDVAL